MFQVLDIIAQICAVIFGAPAIFIVGLVDPYKKRYGYLCGIISIPFWFYTLIYHQQWFVCIVNCLYAFSWINGFKNNRRIK